MSALQLQFSFDTRKVGTISEFQAWLEQHKQWADATFPSQTIQEKLEHCDEELQEILAQPTDLHEWADATILLLNALVTQGYTLEQLLEAMQEKHEICKKRKWVNNRHIEEVMKEGAD